jgi:hypothetical protein
MQYFRQRKYIIFVIFNKKGRKKPPKWYSKTTSGAWI